MKDALRRLEAILRGRLAGAPSQAFPSLRLYRGQRLALVFIPLLLATLLNSFLALHSLDTLVASERLVSRTHAVQTQIHVVETRLVDAENAQRGYLLTGDTRYLAPYIAAHSSLPDEIDRLRTLTNGDAAQQRQIDAFEPLVAPLFDMWQQHIDLRAQQRTDEAIAEMRNDNAQQTMDTIRAHLAEMDGTEEQLLEGRLRTVGNSISEAQVTMLVASLADIVLLVALFVLVWRAFAAREQHLQTESAARAAAEEAVTLRDEFLSIASHELRTPLSVLLVNTQLLERFLSRKDEQDERIQQSFAAIQRQLSRLQTLIATMLDVSRIERGQLKISHDLFELVALVRSTVDEVQPIAQAHPLELITPSDLPAAIYICGDKMRLEQALLNLLQNAVKYSPDGGTIRVTVARVDDWALISVADRGIGIPEDALPHVFERFYRAPTVRSEHISGMGVGLNIVQEIVALHGGNVTVTSKHGAGSTFTIHLPLAVPQPAPQSSPQPAQ